MLEVGILGAFLAGIVSFVSPCVLPLVPPYLCYIAGLSYDQLADEAAPHAGRVVFSALCFVAGFTLVFVAFGATASVIGQTVSENAGILSKLAGVLIFLFGLHFLGILKFSFLYRQARLEVGQSGSHVGAFLMGLAFAFGWTPCVGPILAAILFMAGGGESVGQGIGLLTAYALGIGLPFILAAAFVSKFLSVATVLRRHMGMVEKIAGGFLIATGLLFFFGGMDDIGYWILETFPALGAQG